MISKLEDFTVLIKKKIKLILKILLTKVTYFIFCPTIEHGVDSIDYKTISENYDWNSGVGRWWMGLFTNDSNEKKNRKTSNSLKSFTQIKFKIK